MRTRVHINLPVRDVAASSAFYAGLFGQEPSTTRADYANFRLDAPALHLALVAFQAAAGSPHQHFGVELFDHEDLKGLRARAVEAGLAVRDEEQIACCYAVGDKFWATDPDGHEWEFWVRTGASDTLAPRPTAGAACCAPAAEPAAAESSCCAPAAEPTAAESSCCAPAAEPPPASSAPPTDPGKSGCCG